MRTEPFHPRIGYPIEEDDSGLYKFCRNCIANGGDVPRPAHFRMRAQEASKSEQSVTPENATLWDDPY